MRVGVGATDPNAEFGRLVTALGGLAVAASELKNGQAILLALEVVGDGFESAVQQSGAHHTEVLAERIQHVHDFFGWNRRMLGKPRRAGQ